MATLLAFAPLDALYCGSESADSKKIAAQAAYLKSQQADYDLFIRESADLSYSEASQRFLANAGLTAGKETPNDRLALHYRLALPEEIPLHLVHRDVSHHSNAPHGAMMSASAIRAHLPHALKVVGAYLPNESVQALAHAYENGAQNPDYTILLTTLKVLACSMSAPALAVRLHIHEGWEHRFLEAVRDANDFSDLLTRAQTKHYSRSRIQRLVLSLLSPLPQAPPSPGYVRVLGFSQRGRTLLKNRDKNIPLILNTAKDARALTPDAQALLEGDIHRQNLADLLCQHLQQNRDYIERPRIM